LQFHIVLNDLGANYIQKLVVGQCSLEILDVVTENRCSLLKSVEILSSPFLTVSLADNSNKHIEKHDLSHEGRAQEVKPNEVLADLGVGFLAWIT